MLQSQEYTHHCTITFLKQRFSFGRAALFPPQNADFSLALGSRLRRRGNYPARLLFCRSPVP